MASEGVNDDMLQFLEKANLMGYKDALLEQGHLFEALSLMYSAYHITPHNQLPMAYI